METQPVSSYIALSRPGFYTAGFASIEPIAAGAELIATGWAALGGHSATTTYSKGFDTVTVTSVVL